MFRGGGIIPLFFCFEKVADKACQWNRLLIFFKPYHVFYLCYKQLCDMAKLYINKDIVADKDKMENWYLTGDEGLSFPDIQYFLSWLDPADPKIDIEIHSCGGDTVEGYAIYDALRASGKEISCTVVGRCASMATIILLSAPLERRKAYPHAKFLIHKPYLARYDDLLDLETIESIKSSLEAEKDKMMAVYVERTGVEPTILEVQMNKEAWFGGEVAKQLGFISDVLIPTTAKGTDYKLNSEKMNKEKQVTVKQSIIDRLLAKCGYQKIEDIPVVSMELTDAEGNTLMVEREEGEPQVGDAASPDGEHVMPDGKTIIVTDGVITEIKDPEEANGDEEIEALKARIEELEEENAALKTNARTVEDNKILNAVKMAGGENWLAKHCSTYRVSLRTQSFKNTVETQASAEETPIQRKLREEREKRVRK
nr:MAG: Clp protease [Bacteriophage sp.]